MSITATEFLSDHPDAITAEAEDRFFASLKTGNNTFKRTEVSRFAGIDERCIEIFGKAGGTLSEVLDIGVSSGVTTLELSELLIRAGQDPLITGTDLALTAYLLEVGPGLRVLVDEHGHALQYEIFGRAVRAWVRRADYVTGMILLLGALRLLTRGKVRRLLRAENLHDHELVLLSRRVRNNPRIAVESNDILQLTDSYIGRFDFVRAANILNRGYFDEGELRRAIGNVARYLSGPGAWLLVARSVEQKTAGTLFRLAADGRRFKVSCRFGEGSEIESLVLGTVLPHGWGDK